MRYSLNLLLGFFLLVSTDLLGEAYDSLRIETKEAQRMVIHQVDAGETIFGLSRRYGTTIDNIRKSNDLTGNDLNIGQLLSIPIAMEAPITKVDTLSNQITHRVEAGETLYGISRQYGLTVAELKTLNDMSENSLELGALLIVGMKSDAETEEVAQGNPEPVVVATGSLPENRHIVEAGETIYSIARRYGVDVQELREANGLTSNSISIDQSLIIPFEVAGEELVADSLELVTMADTTLNTQDSSSSASTVQLQAPVKYGNSDKRDTTNLIPGQVIEEGFAMTIENAPKTKKYLALHRSVPIGTIMQVRNQMNNQSIFVRVVGKLPDTGPNKKVLIRLTQQAFDRLGAIDPKIPVEVAYMRE